MIGLIALADAFGELFQAIADDWEAHRPIVERPDQPWTAERIQTSFVRLGRDLVDIDPEGHSSLHPELHDQARVMGHWSY